MFKPEGLAAGLDVVGRLSILADDAPFQVEFRGSTIEIVIPDLRTVLHLRRRFSRGERRAWAKSLRSMMALTDLELRVWVRGRQVGRIAPSSKQGWLAVWLGVDPLELSIGAILATLLSHQHPASDGKAVPSSGSETR